MKKSTVNILLIAGAAAAAWFIFTSMRKRRGSSVEAGSPIKISEKEYEEAEVVSETPKGGQLIKTGQSVVDVIKSLKRSPEKKQAAKARKVLRKQPKAKKAVQTFLSMPRVIRGFDEQIGLY